MNLIQGALRAVKGAASLDEMLEMLSVVGIDADVKPLPGDGMTGIVGRALTPGNRLFVMDAKLKGGQPLVALLILPPETGV